MQPLQSLPVLILSLAAAWLPLPATATRAANQPDPNPGRPVLHTRSNTITIVDGDHVRPGAWIVMPEKNPDVYYVEFPMKSHAVTFRSDVDSITFPVRFGDQHDFVVLLNDAVGGTIPCPTRIRAVYRDPHPFSRTDPNASTPDAIPFRLGDNNKIYIKGRLNDRQPLDFQFDLGSMASVIKKGSVPKTHMRFDGTVRLQNSDGDNLVPSSSSNRLRIANLQWDRLPFVVADNMTHREDGLVGNALFQDKVIEINYDRMEILVHDAPPAVHGYSKHALVPEGVVPFIQGSLTLDGRRRDGLFMFDTGAYTSILFSKTVSPAGKLFGELRDILPGDKAPGPRLTVADYPFADFNYTIRNHDHKDQLGLLGNDILKRFNVILDNQNGHIYLKPNAHAADPYLNPEYYLARFLAVGVVVVPAAAALVVYRLRSRRRMKRKTTPAPSPAVP